MTIFDILKSISNDKNDLSDEPEFEKAYNPFMINRYVSMLKDTAIYAEYADKMANLPKKLQYQFYLNAIPKKNRFFAYQKSEAKDEDVTNIMKYFYVSESKAKSLIKVLPQESIREINNLINGLNK